jgi:lipid II:glycine glycyltransferase (peptidoglycan interpeptide bridge formation enzyme)
VKSQYGWQPYHLVWDATYHASVFNPKLSYPPPSAGALMLQRQIPVGGFSARMRVLYIPKGPLIDWSQPELRFLCLNDLATLAQRQGAIFIKIDPDVPLGCGIPGETGSKNDSLGQTVIADLRKLGWRFSQEQIQFRNTVLVDLEGNEEDLIQRMKQKTRYNIRLAMRKGVKVRAGTFNDINLLYRMYAETAQRDRFVIREERYYRHVWSTFLSNMEQFSGEPGVPVAEPLIAEVEGEPVAAVIIFRFAGKAWYLYGMSSQAHREKMPNALLQWEAMRRAKMEGCKVYDLWGAPDIFDESDSLWGVYRFKEGLGGKVSRTIGAWDLPVRPMLYRLYSHTLPRLLEIMRLRSQIRNRGRASALI